MKTLIIDIAIRQAFAYNAAVTPKLTLKCFGAKDDCDLLIYSFTLLVLINLSFYC